MLRYYFILGKEDLVRQYEQVFLLDADLRVVAPVTEEDIFSDGITAVQHYNCLGDPAVPTEDRKESVAYCPQVGSAYYHGAIVGGQTEAFLKMAQAVVAGLDQDLNKRLVASWWEESHLNRYLNLVSKPAKVLTPSYCYPETNITYYIQRWGQNFPRKIMQIDKPKRRKDQLASLSNQKA